MTTLAWTEFRLPATETYSRRLCVWVPGGTLSLDGFLTITCVKKNGTCDGPFTYGVMRDGCKVTVWRVDVDDNGPPVLAQAKRAQAMKRKPYVVTVGAVYRCSCRSRVACKHLDGTAELIRRGLI